MTTLSRIRHLSIPKPLEYFISTVFSEVNEERIRNGLPEIYVEGEYRFVCIQNHAYTALQLKFSMALLLGSTTITSLSLEFEFISNIGLNEVARRRVLGAFKFCSMQFVLLIYLLCITTSSTPLVMRYNYVIVVGNLQENCRLHFCSFFSCIVVDGPHMTRGNTSKQISPNCA